MNFSNFLWISEESFCLSIHPASHPSIYLSIFQHPASSCWCSKESHCQAKKKKKCGKLHSIYTFIAVSPVVHPPLRILQSCLPERIECNFPLAPSEDSQLYWRGRKHIWVQGLDPQWIRAWMCSKLTCNEKKKKKKKILWVLFRRNVTMATSEGSCRKDGEKKKNLGIDFYLQQKRKDWLFFFFIRWTVNY